VARNHILFALFAAGLAVVLAVQTAHAADALRQLAQYRERDRDRFPPGGPPGPPPGARDLQILGQARVNNRTPIIVFRIDPRQSRVSEIRFRSGELPLLIDTAEIVYADGQRQRVQILDRIEPGQQSRAIEVDRRRPIREVSVTKQPRFRPGETTVQLIGVVDAGPSGPPPGQWSGVGPKIPQGWVLFGVQEVNFRGDRDVIRVGEQMGRFERLALRISDNDIFLRELTIVYGNGDRDRKIIETAIPAGSQTRPIELRGDRFIREIELVYRSNPARRDPAVVEVYGDISNTWIGDQGRQRGWLMLGAERVSMFSKERDAIRVDPRVGRIKAIRFAARRSDITFYSARIVYENGEAENLPFARKLRDGEYTSPIDLRGRGRRIDRIELKYRSKLGLKGEGIVEVWGLN
jgi:hypothetical protein